MRWSSTIATALALALVACSLTGSLVQAQATRDKAPAPTTQPDKPAGDTSDTKTGGWRLAAEKSEYLRMHAGNPVDWYPWGTEAFEQAKKLDRPVFLSIGYASCHWCHVMRRESFEDATIAKVLNEKFISIKVDREELPHIDDVYMAAVQLMTQQGGWPLTVFMTPEGKPFFGGTYFPPREKFGRPGFGQLAESIHEGWTQERKDIEDFGNRLTNHLSELGELRTGDVDRTTFVDRGVAIMQANWDTKKGGLAGAPKFPSPRLLVLFGALSVLDEREDLAQLATHTAMEMARGGLFDQIGGGFHRYSVDADWHVPHFEKMLYTQGLLTETYLELYRFTEDQELAEVARRTLDALLRDFSTDAGGFASSWDADSEEEEGTYYVWTPAQVREAFPNKPETAEYLIAYLGLTDEGNFEGKRSVPRQAIDQFDVSMKFSAPVQVVQTELRDGIARLLEIRSKRVPPLKDEKVILGWNALAVSALARGGIHLGNPKYTAAAVRAHAFADRHLALEAGFLRRWADGSAAHPATLRDAALHLKATLDLYEATFDPQHVIRARSLASQIARDYGPASEKRTSDEKDEAASSGAFFETRAGVDVLVPRRRVVADSALPSGNAVLARALLRLHALTTEDRFRQWAEGIVNAALPQLLDAPHQSPEFMLAALQLTSPDPEIAVYGDLQHPLTRGLITPLQRSRLPFFTLCQRSPGKTGADAARVIQLLQNRETEGHRPTAYLCENFACLAPESDPKKFKLQYESLMPRKRPEPPQQPDSRPASQPKDSDRNRR